MRILAINDVPHGGGAAQLFRRTNFLLRQAGHEVYEFTGGGEASSSPAFPRQAVKSYLSQSAAGRVFHRAASRIYQDLRAVRRAVRHLYAPRLIRRLDASVRGRSFDVVHVHNIHNQLSPQIFRYLKSKSIPIVYQVNDYFFFCNNYAAYNNALNLPCKRCINGNAAWALRYGCSSYGSTHGMAAVTAEAARRAALRVLNPWKAVDLYLVTSEAAAGLLAEWGVEAGRCRKITNPMIMSEFDRPTALGDEIVFYGGFLIHKGTDTFLSALEHVAVGTKIGVYLMGTTEVYRAALEKVAARRNLRLTIDSSIRWDTGLRDVVAHARAIVIPSQWWVTSENVVYEGMLFGKAVLVSRAGGNAELIEDNVTGLLFEPYDARRLADLINMVSADKNLAENLGKRAAQRARAMFSEANFVENLTSVYRAVVRK